MGNTKALEVCYITGRIAGDPEACGDCDPCIFGASQTPPQIKSLFKEISDLRTQLAERDAQLAAERELSECLARAATPLIEGTYWITHTHIDYAKQAIDTFKATRQPTQDKGE